MTLAPADVRAIAEEVVRLIPGGILTRDRLALYLGVSTDTVDRRIADGSLPPGRRATKEGGRVYWLREDIDSAIRAWETSREIEDAKLAPFKKRPGRPRKGGHVAIG